MTHLAELNGHIERIAVELGRPKPVLVTRELLETAEGRALWRKQSAANERELAQRIALAEAELRARHTSA